MPIKFRCYQCDKLLATKDGSEGRSFACPGCGAGLVVPGEAPESVDIPALAPVDTREAGDKILPRTMPSEPWYYSILVLWAYTWIIIGIAQFIFFATTIGAATLRIRADLSGDLPVLGPGRKRLDASRGGRGQEPPGAEVRPMTRPGERGLGRQSRGLESRRSSLLWISPKFDTMPRVMAPSIRQVMANSHRMQRPTR